MPLPIIAFFMALILLFGVIEKMKHRQNLHSVPIRINVNGIRGKSTVTRLVTGILAEAGIKVVGKTTGTSARMIYWFQKEEKPIIRRPEGPNIGEQRRVVAEAAKLGAEALVCECMAVNPDYQVTFQEQLLKANIGVIVNVLEDHMEVLGPSLDDVAEAFTATIPYNGYLIISQSSYAYYFQQIAANRGTKTIVMNTSTVTEEYLNQFDYVVFPENIALALGVAEALSISRDVALRGMLQANPDPGVLRISELKFDNYESSFVNGFAANDAASTLSIWERIKALGYPTDNLITIMNCRADRIDRTQQFATDVLPHLQSETVILIGEQTTPIIEAYKEGKISAKHFLNLEGHTPQEIFSIIKEQVIGSVIFGIGNIHGAAEVLVDLFEQAIKSDLYLSEDLIS